MVLDYLRSTNFGSSAGAGPATGFMFGLNSIAKQMRSSIESCCKSILQSCPYSSLFVLTSIIVLFFCSCWDPPFARAFTRSRKLWGKNWLINDSQRIAAKVVTNFGLKDYIWQTVNFTVPLSTALRLAVQTAGEAKITHKCLVCVALLTSTFAMLSSSFSTLL